MWSLMTISMLLMTGMPASEAPGIATVDANGLLCAEPTVSAEPEPAFEITPQSVCTASANCWDGSTASCSASGPGVTCSAVDSDCDAGVRGQATCDGQTVFCPRCPEKAYCNCHLPDGSWGMWQGGVCTLKFCILPLE